MGRHAITLVAGTKMREMKTSGFTLDQIAKDTGYHRTTICNFLNGKTHVYKYSCKGCSEPTDSEYQYCKSEACQKLYRQDYYIASGRQRGYYRQSIHGLSEADFEAMYLSQNGICKICDEPKTREEMRIDHCHATGKIRGLLCHRCNVGLGHFQDDVTRMRRAIGYLECA